MLDGGISDPSAILNLAALAEQPVGVAFTDPVFGTTLRRVSDTSARGGFETQVYSQLQAFSSDNQYLLLTGSNGYIVRRVSDLSVVSGLDTSDWNAPRWHPTQPNVIIHFDTNADTDVAAQFTNVDTGVTTDAFTFPAQYQFVRTNQSFDEVSDDGRWLAGMLTRNDGASVIFALDVANRALGAVLPVGDLFAGPCAPDPVWGAIEPDWIGVSPLGRYLVVQWARDGTARCSGLETFHIQTGAFVGRVYDGHQHGDLGVQPDGNTEFFMTFELSGPPPDNGRPAIGMRLLPGTTTASDPTFLRVLDWGNGDHISCRGPNGVCLVTAGTLADNGWNPFEGEVFIQRTDGGVLRLAHHRSSRCGYWVQPRATISRDGRYVVFASDWGQPTGADSCGNGNDLGAGDPYLIDLESSSGGSGGGGAAGGIQGRAFADKNGNRTFDAGEALLRRWTVYLDLNGNAAHDSGEPFVQTHPSTAAYEFQGLAPDTYTVRLVPKNGYVSDSRSITVSDGQVVGGAGVSAYRPARITGRLFHDANRDGRQNAGERGQSGRVVFLDFNGNGSPDTSEPSRVTSANGQFSFDNLRPGTFAVFQVVPAGWLQTVPADALGRLVTLLGAGRATVLFGSNRTAG
jgi:hypothetical protein